MLNYRDNEPACYARTEQLDRLAGLLDEALAGEGSVCFVTGEPGAGKSALLHAFAAQAGARYPEAVVVHGDCNPQVGLGDPYLPFREILTALTGSEPEPPGDLPAERTSARFLSAAKRAVAEHGPDLIDIFVPGGGLITRVGSQAAQKLARKRGHGGEIVLPDGIGQGHLFEQYTNVLRELAARQPLVLLLDDLHWADEASIALLFHLSRRLGEDRVLLAGAYRSADIAARREGERHPLAAKLNEMKRYFGDVWVDLGLLGKEDGRAFINDLLDAEPNDLDESFRALLLAKTGGHALFTVELLRHLKEVDVLKQDALGRWTVTGNITWDGLPARVEGVIGERADRLNPLQRDILAAASVLGDTFQSAAVAEMLQMDDREVRRELSGPLSREHQLVRASGLSTMGGQRMAEYEFTHNLFQAFFYETLDTVERCLSHEAAGYALEQILGTETSSAAVDLARHFGAAQIWDKAIAYRNEAGQQAQAEYAQAEAREHYESALVMLEEFGDTLPPDEQLTLEQVLRSSFGRVLTSDGEYGEAREAFKQAIDCTGDAEPLVRAELHRQIGLTYERQRRHEEALQELDRAAGLIGEPSEASGADWWQEWIALSIDRVRMSYWIGDVAAMTPLLERLEPALEEFGNPAQRRYFWTGQAMRGYRLDRFDPSEETVAASDRALAAARESDSLLDLSDALFGAGFSRMLRGECSAALPLLADALQAARRCGDRSLQARSLTYQLNTLRRLREFERVETLLPETRAAVEACDMQDYIALCEATEAWLAWRRRRPGGSDSARAALERWAEHMPGYPMKWPALFPLLASELDSQSLEGAVQAARELLDETQTALSGKLSEMLGLAVGHYETGDEIAAGDCLLEAVKLAEAYGYL